jgi:hypothetical protein
MYLRPETVALPGQSWPFLLQERPPARDRLTLDTLFPPRGFCKGSPQRSCDEAQVERR